MPPFIKNDIIYSELVDNDCVHIQQQDVQQNNIVTNIQYDVSSPMINLNDSKSWINLNDKSWILLGCNLDDAISFLFISNIYLWMYAFYIFFFVN